MNYQLAIIWSRTELLLVAITAALLVLFLTSYNASVSSLFFLAAVYIAYRRKGERNYHSDIASTTWGIMLLLWVVLRMVLSSGGEDFLTRISPFIAAIALCLLASGKKGLAQYWQELLIMGFASVPNNHIGDFLSSISSQLLPQLDAKFSAYLLWYLSFDAVSEGTFVILPTGAIEVIADCSSYGMVFLLWQCTIILTFIFNLSRGKGIRLFCIAPLIAISVNGMRLALLAFLVAEDNQTGFHYWHSGSGGDIFATIAMVFLVGVYYLLNNAKSPSFPKKPNSPLLLPSPLEKDTAPVKNSTANHHLPQLKPPDSQENPPTN